MSQLPSHRGFSDGMSTCLQARKTGRQNWTTSRSWSGRPSSAGSCSRDQDFLRVSLRWQQSERLFVGILYAHQQGASIGRLVEDIELITACCEPEELSNRVTYLPL